MWCSTVRSRRMGDGQRYKKRRREPLIAFQVILFWFALPKLTLALITVVMTSNQLEFSMALLLSDLTALPSQTRSLCVSETLLLQLYEPQAPTMRVPPQRLSRWKPSPPPRQHRSVLPQRGTRQIQERCFQRELVCGRSLVHAAHTMVRHLLDLGHQPTPKVVCYSL